MKIYHYNTFSIYWCRIYLNTNNLIDFSKTFKSIIDYYYGETGIEMVILVSTSYRIHKDIMLIGFCRKEIIYERETQSFDSSGKKLFFYGWKSIWKFYVRKVDSRVLFYNIRSEFRILKEFIKRFFKIYLIYKMEKFDYDNCTLRLYNNLTSEYDSILVKYNKETNTFNFNNLTKGRCIIPIDNFLERYYPVLPEKLNSVYGEFIASEIIKKNREKLLTNLLD